MPEAPYAGKSIVLTGASSGIGRALALALAPQRPRLALAARDSESLADVAEECRALGAEAMVVPTDVGEPAECAFLVDTAGGSMLARFDELTYLSVFESLMRANYLGGAYLTPYALPHLKARRG